MIQVICWRNTTALNQSAARFTSPGHSRIWSSDEVDGRHPWSCTGTLRNLLIRLSAAPGTGVSATYTLRINGVDTALSVTISGTNTEGSDQADDIAVTAGDLISLRRTTSGGTPTTTEHWGSIEFEGATGESGYGVACNIVNSDTLANYNGVFTGLTQYQTAITSQMRSLVAAAGAITRYDIKVNSNPGIGGSGRGYIFALYKNGVKQDGSGGTVDTRVSVLETNTVGSASFNLSVSPGDTVYQECTPTGAPAPNAVRVAWGVKFTATTDGESQFCGSNLGNPDVTLTEYQALSSAVAWDTEASTEGIGGITSFGLKGFQMILQNAPGGGKSRTFTLRRNQATPANTPNIAISGVGTTGSDLVNSIAIEFGDEYAVQAVPSGSPADSSALWSFIQDLAPPATPDVETLVASGVRSTQARIRGRIDPNGLTATGRFAWGLSPASLTNETNDQAIGSGSTFVTYSELLTDLTPATTYYYRAIANDGTDDYLGEILSFTTLGEQVFIDGNVSHPLTWITLTKRDETRHPYAEVDLNDAPHYYDGYKRPRVNRFLTISRGLSDRDGQIEHLTFGAVLSDIKTDRFDADREFRELLDDVTNKYLTNRPLEEWFIDDEDRRIEGLARLAAVGFVNDYAPRANLQFEINGADWLKKKFSRKRKAQQSWQPLITVEDFPDCDEDTLNTPAPIIYGSLGLTGADPVENVQIVINAQPTAAPTGFALTLVAGGRYSGVRRYYKVSQVVSGQESIQTATLSATTTDANKTIRLSWTPSGSATAIWVYSSHRPDFSQFAITTLPGSATSYDDDTTPPNQNATFLDGTDWVLGLRLNLTYYVYAKLAGGLYSRPGIVSTFLAPVPVRGKIAADRTGPLLQRDIDITWDPHPDEVDGYRIVRHRSYYSNWTPVFDRQIDVSTGVLTTTDDNVTTNAVTVPSGELLALSATGQVQAIPVGLVTIGSPADLNGLLIARHACSRVGTIYIPVTTQNVEGEDETTYEPVPESEFGNTWFAPDHAGWLFAEKYLDINDRRYTLIFTTVSPLPETVLVDVDGIETDGDGEGTLITSIVDQRLHFMNNFIAPDTPYQNGPYLTAADTTFPHIPDLPLVDEISHQIVKAQLAERLGTGDYEGATIIGAAGEFVTATDALARFHVSGDFDQAFNRKGQDTISCEPIEASEDLDEITDVISIRDGSFNIHDQVQTAFFNILPYVHTRDYTGRLRTGWYGSGEERSQTSIDNYDQERESPRFELHCLRSNTTQGTLTIADVMARKLARYQDPRRTGTLTMPFSGLNYEPGSTAAVTHIEGIGAEGWVLKEVRFTRHEVNPTDGLVRLDFYDLTKVFENQVP